jgi:hypothetical protein
MIFIVVDGIPLIKRLILFASNAATSAPAPVLALAGE